jgi:hypothetical protein
MEYVSCLVNSLSSDQALLVLAKRLDALINVLLETARPGGKPISSMEKVRILSDAGLRPVEIAQILGISATHVSVNLHDLRKAKKPKK